MQLNEKFWERYLNSYDVLNDIHPYRQLLVDICSLLKIIPNEIILDAGCGTGNLSVVMKKMGAKCIGLDSNIAAVHIYNQKIGDHQGIEGNLTQKFPFPDKSFDKIVCNNVLYSIASEKRGEVLKEFYRVLKTNGILVISDPVDHFKKRKIFISAFRYDLTKLGLLGAIVKELRMVVLLFKPLYYNLLIDYFVKQNPHINSHLDHIELLKTYGFLADLNMVSYAGQNIISRARKTT